MRISRAIPLLVAGAAAAWLAGRRKQEAGPRPEPLQYQPPRPVEPEEPPASPPAAPPDPADQPTTEAPAIEEPEPPAAPADVTSVVDDLVAPAPENGEIVDAEVVDEDA
jgi:hypothetical protein